ncbi:MAG TPA: LapA family protein [Devosia sp.]|nr:LapA family protein [Devosia sp.]
MVRRILGWIVLVPLSAALIIFALANRQLTVINFNPLAAPSSLDAPGIGMPLFLVIFVALLLGVVLGGFATWLTQGRVRREKRQWQREADRLGRELDTTRRSQRPARTSRNEIDDLVDSN